MIQNLPIYIPLLFIVIMLITLFLFYNILKKSSSINIQNKAGYILLGFVLWIILQSILSLTNVYSNHLDSLPPKILILGLLPNIMVILLLFITKKGRLFIDSLPIFNLTNLNSIRVLVELILWLLFLNNTVPELMTFEGRNFDIIVGLSAPIISYLVFNKKLLGNKSLLIWNIISLLLLFNIAFLSLNH